MQRVIWLNSGNLCSPELTQLDFFQNSPHSPIESPNAPARFDQARSGILLSCDLIFTTKIKETARSLGYEIEVISDVAKAKVQIELLHPPVILIDLTAGELSTPELISEYMRRAGAKTWLVAFGPHVETQDLVNAKTAGCQIVLPRSKFARDLPSLLQVYFTELPADGCKPVESSSG